MDKMKAGLTHVSYSMPWGLHPRNGHRLLCSDGVIRAASMAQTADTFFSVPASVRVNGKTITGYMTGEEACSPDFKRHWKACVFRQHDGQESKSGLPAWPEKFTPEHLAIVQKADCEVKGE